jgi:hypothetical protein
VTPLGMELEITQHIVDELGSNVGKIHLLIYFFYHICQLENLLNTCSELPDRLIIDFKQVYQQVNRHTAAFQIF